MFVFLLIYAPGFGGTIPLGPALQADYFGTAHYGTIVGSMRVIAMVGGLISPIIAGWIFDTVGSYQPAWLVFAVATIPAIPLILMAPPPSARTRQMQ